MAKHEIIHAALFTPINRERWGLPILFRGDPGVGKCLGRGTPVLLHDGKIVPVEEIRTTEDVMGPDSRPRRVQSVTKGTGPLYRIVPKKGAPWVCNDVHVLTLVHSVTNEVLDIPLDKYLALPANTKHHLKLFQPEAIDFGGDPEADLPIDPYFIGVWFGDGTKALNSVSISKPDAEIERLCRDVASAWGLHVSVTSTEGGRCPTYRIVSDSRGPNTNPLLTKMREVIGDGREIPTAYLTADRSVRQEVLAGLLDTDGYKVGSCYEIVQKSPGIARGIAFLARSLGFRVTEKIKVVNGDTYRRLFLSGDATQLPMRIARKAPQERLQKKNPLRTGFSVEAIGDGEYFGFTLTGDGRFLLGDFTVTHNTSVFKDVAEAAGLDCEVLSPGERGEGAFGVTPVPLTHQNGKTVLSYPPPEWTERMVTRGFVLLDEMSSCPPALQPALLGTLQERVIGGYTLPAGVRVMGTANSTEQAAGGWDLAMPVANRIGHLKWECPTPAEWGEWLISMDSRKATKQQAVMTAEAEERRVLDAWATPWARARAFTSGFLSRRPELLLKCPNPNDPMASAAWPSPRSWENATRAYASALVHNLSEIDRDTLVGAFIGDGPAGELATWVEATDLPDPVEILSGMTKWKPDVRRLDITNAVLASCTAIVVSEKNAALRKARAEKLWELLAIVAEDAADQVEGPIRILCSPTNQLMTAGGIKALAKLKPILDAVNEVAKMASAPRR